MAQLFRFKELTIVVASERVVRHIGPGLWDEEFESYHYSDVTDLAFEDGSVNTSVVLTVDGQRERFKTPNEDARAVRSTLESTLLSYWEVDSVEELRAATAPEESETETEKPESAEDVSFGGGPDPLFSDPTEPEDLPDNATRTPDYGTPGDESASDGETAANRTVSGTDASRPDADDSGQATATDTAGSEPSGTEGRGTSAGTEPAPTAAATDSATRGGAGTGGDASDAADAPDGSASTEPPDAGFEGSGFEAAAPATDEQVLEELTALREVVERQNEELKAQRELIEQLIEELRRGR